MRFHEPTIAYFARRTAEGKSKRDIIRCLKRHVIREVYHLVKTYPTPAKSRVDNYRSINAMIESFWGTMQVELLNRKKWKTRLQLANAIFDYIEIYYNRQRRHSALHWKTPEGFEKPSDPLLWPHEFSHPRGTEPRTRQNPVRISE